MAVSAQTIYGWMHPIPLHFAAIRCVGELSCFNRQCLLEMAPPIPPSDSHRESAPKPVTWAKVVATSTEDSSSERKADRSSDGTGPGPQPLRGMSGFPAQQQAQARNAALASTRLPNGKIGATAPFAIQDIYIYIYIGNQKANKYGGKQAVAPTGISGYPWAVLQVCRTISSATWEQWGILHRAWEDHNLQHLWISRECKFYRLSAFVAQAT